MGTSEFGINEHGVPVSWDPAYNHVVTVGQTGSGKSVTSYNMLLGAAFDPRVAVLGIDPSSVLGGPFAQVNPGTWVLGSSPEAVDSALDLLTNVIEIMETRLKRLNRVGRDKIPPEWLGPHGIYSIRLVLEEYAGLIAAANGMRNKDREIMRLVGRILQEGRKVNVNVLTILQRPEASVLNNRGQYQMFIMHLLENAASVNMLFEGASEELVKTLTTLPPGVGGVKKLGPDPLVRFRAPMMDYSVYRANVLAHGAQGEVIR